jgi:hypothetical protein
MNGFATGGDTAPGLTFTFGGCEARRVDFDCQAEDEVQLGKVFCFASSS